MVEMKEVLWSPARCKNCAKTEIKNLPRDKMFHRNVFFRVPAYGQKSGTACEHNGNKNAKVVFRHKASLQHHK